MVGKFFLTPFEWQEAYGFTIIPMKSKTLRGTHAESQRILEKENCPISASGYTVMSNADLRTFHYKIEEATGLYASSHWTVDDILMRRKNWTEEQAREWLEANAKYIQEAMTRAGWEAIEALL